MNTANNGDTTYQVNENELGKYMTAREYRKLDIPSIKFEAKFKYLFGSPAINFYMIVTGPPGHGKTTFLLQFGEYLQKNFGKTLFLPAEQPNQNKDFQNALNRFQLDHLLIAPESNNWNLERVISEINTYGIQFIILDSVNYMEFTPDDIKELRRQCPNVAILAVLQSLSLIHI